MTTHLLRTLALTCTLAMAGCAATVTRSGPAPAPLSVSPAATRAVFVRVEAAPGMPPGGHWETFKTDWREGMSMAAGRSGMLVTWVDSEEVRSADPAVLVVVKVRNYQYMTPESRIGLGILAGDAYVNTEVESYELPARKLLGSRVYGSSTRPVEGIFAASTRKQVLSISDEVIADIRR